MYDPEYKNATQPIWDHIEGHRAKSSRRIRFSWSQRLISFWQQLGFMFVIVDEFQCYHHRCSSWEEAGRTEFGLSFLKLNWSDLSLESRIWGFHWSRIAGFEKLIDKHGYTTMISQKLVPGWSQIIPLSRLWASIHCLACFLTFDDFC